MTTIFVVSRITLDGVFYFRCHNCGTTAPSPKTQRFNYDMHPSITIANMSNSCEPSTNDFPDGWVGSAKPGGAQYCSACAMKGTV